MEVWSGNSHLSAHKLKLMVAKVVQDKDNQRCPEGTKDLEVQGRFLKILSDSPHSQIDYWSKAVWSLPAKQMAFAVNSTQDMLPHNSNLRQWKRPVAPSCLLCGDLQTLRHVLNGCLRALQGRRYDARHNEVLQEIARHLENHFNLVEYQLLADLDSDYTFPPQLCPTTEKPDIVIWNERTKVVYLMELTVCFDENLLRPVKESKLDTTVLSRLAGKGLEVPSLASASGSQRNCGRDEFQSSACSLQGLSASYHYCTKV